VAPRRGASMLAVLLALGGLLFGGVALWQVQMLRAEQASADAGRDAQAALLARLERDAGEGVRGVRTIERRLGDAEGVNQSVREEVLGLGERARLLEDAVARLADRNLSGTVLLRLNEAEFLLRMGHERLRLFDDAPATIAAFQLADAELAALEDPLFAGVRQTIAAEIAALAAVPQIDRSALLARLDMVADSLPTLPVRNPLADARPPELPPAAGWLDRAGAALGQFVRVREVATDASAWIDPLNADAARAALAIELALTKAALVSRDEAALRAAGERARRHVSGTFAVEQASVQQALTALDAVLASPAQAAWPDIGRSLVELRNLRATRALATPPASAEAPAAPAP